MALPPFPIKIWGEGNPYFFAPQVENYRGKSERDVAILRATVYLPSNATFTDRDGQIRLNDNARGRNDEWDIMPAEAELRVKPSAIGDLYVCNI